MFFQVMRWQAQSGWKLFTISQAPSSAHMTFEDNNNKWISMYITAFCTVLCTTINLVLYTSIM